MRTLEDGSPVVCDVVDDMPLCYVFKVRSEGRTPNPDDWETGGTFLLGPYPLPITCPDCLEVRHS